MAIDRRELATKFHLEQLKELRGEIEDCIKYQRQIEIYTVVGNVAVWTFMLTHTPLPAIAVYAWWGPVVLDGFALLKHIALRKQLDSLSDYIHRAQTKLSFENLGWERSCEHKKVKRIHSWFNWWFWSVLLCVSIGVAVSFTWYNPIPVHQGAKYDRLGTPRFASSFRQMIRQPDISASITVHDGRKTTGTDQAGRQVSREIDALGRLGKVTEPGGLTTLYSYDALDNLTAVNQSALTRSFQYSSLSRLLSATNPESSTITTQRTRERAGALPPTSSSSPFPRPAPHPVLLLL